MSSWCGWRVSVLGMALMVQFTCGKLPAAAPIPLRAGPLTMVFDVENAFLRYVHAGPYEVLRGINAPVRNATWGTVVPKVTNVQIENGGDHFSVSFDALCQDNNVDFQWKGYITGTSDGAIEFTFDGVAHSSFRKNRIGFCVLHGPSAAGSAWRVHHTDGSQTPGKFPERISPHQPAKDISAIDHELGPGVWAHVEFSGDVFEMEDQRNWTDASFKTYCTPLEIPYPVDLANGTKISQRVRLHVSGPLPTTPLPAVRPALTVGKNRTPLPRLGLCESTEVDQLTETQLARLSRLHLDHLRVDVSPSENDFGQALQRAASHASTMNVKLHIAVHLGENVAADLERLAVPMRHIGTRVSTYLIVSPDPQAHRLAQKILEPLSPGALIVPHYDTNFVDLNRLPPAGEDLQGVSYAVNPQIHAFDNASMVETLPIQAETVRTARAIFGERPVLISPISLRPRARDLVTPPHTVPADVDRRQSSAFAAAWTLGSVKYLADVSLPSLTCFETVGWKGVMERDQVNDREFGLSTKIDSLFPVYHLLREIGEFAGGDVRQCDSSNTLAAVGLVLEKSGKTRTLIANLTDQPQEVNLHGINGAAKIVIWDESWYAAAAMDVNAVRSNESAQEIRDVVSVKLGPYAIGRIDQ